LWQVLEGDLMAEEVIEHPQGFTAQDDQGFADGSPLMAVVGESLCEATGIAFEGGGDEVEDVAEQGVAPFGEATAAGEAAGWVEGDVEAGIGDEGFAVGEAVEGAGEGEEEGGQAGSDARDGPEEAPGLGVMRADGLLQGGEAAGAQGLQESPAIQEELEGLGPDGVVEAEGSPGQRLEGLQVQAVAGWEEGVKILERGLGDGVGGGEVAEQGAQGFGEAGVGALQLGKEEVEELADLVLGAGQLLGQMLVEMGQGAEGGVILEGGGEGLDGERLAEEEGDGAGIEAVGFGAAAGAGAGEVPDLEGGEAVEGDVGPVQA